MNFGFRDRRLTLQKIEVATFRGLADMGAKHRAVAPASRVHETPAPEVLLRQDYTSPLNPLGIKGAGESGITAVGATIASAIDDAISMPGAVRQLPITPQRLRRLLANKI